MNWRDEILQSDVALSGPEVWPSSSAIEAVDRYIHRRPELAFLVARRRLEAGRRERGQWPPEAIGTRVVMRWTDTRSRPRQTEHRGRFVHRFREDPVEDVRSYLTELRFTLVRRVIDRPMLNLSVQLRFFDSAAPGRDVLTWQERWL